MSALSPPASSPLPNSYSHHSFGRSCASIVSGCSTGTVQHHRLRSLSGSSLSSLTSLWAPPFRRPNDIASSRSSSAHNLSLRRVPTGSDRHSTSGSNSRRTSFASVLSSRLRTEPTSVAEHTGARLLDVAESDHERPGFSEDEAAGEQQEYDVTNEVTTAIEPTFVPSPVRSTVEPGPVTDTSITSDEATGSPGARGWLSKLRRRKKEREPKITPRTHRRWNLEHFGSTTSSPVRQSHARHKHSGSTGSSFAFVSAVKSATATIASMSIVTVSGRNGKWHRGHQRSSLASGSDPRPPVDSQRSLMDHAAKQRSRKRRDKLDELIRSEESYVADVKALSNAYFTVVAHHPTSASFARASAQKNISELLCLHDDLLQQLHRAAPFADRDRSTARYSTRPNALSHHTRWHSVDLVPTQATPVRSTLASIRQARRSLNISRSSSDEHTVLRCSPHIVARVAIAFLEHMPRFALYEDYGANFELLLRDIDEVQRVVTTWPDFDKAIEALSAHINPVKSREENRKKAMTIKDLLIKPVQRLPRYELLFSDLCKLTPVCDDPESNAVIQLLLFELHETCQRMNEAKDNPLRSRMLEATWLLGDRLSFSNQVPRSVYLQLLGQVHLCGCLHVAYPRKDRIRGDYMICVLFESTLLLASADDDQVKYSLLAGIPLANMTIEESDNGKGLQCYTAPHSWKLAFEYSARMYEVILTACSAVEASVWREQLAVCIETQNSAVAGGSSNVFELHSPLTADMRSVGKAFGKPSSFVRRMSVHRTATVGPTSDLNQVIIKNTQAVKEAIDNASNTSLQIPRSQSVATPSHVQTLAPRRADRVRLESLLSDVWTKDLLPYPGMAPRRSDPIRASANNVIRKFSMASITSNFSSSKRSASYTSVQQSRNEDMPPPRSKGVSRNSNTRGKPNRLPLVDFHNAPEAFLPADFELQDPAAKRKKSALRTFTMTMERPFSPLLGSDARQQCLKRAQSVRDVVNASPMPTTTPVREKPATPVYSVVQDRTKTPSKVQTSQQSEDSTVTIRDEPAKTPWKSKSKSKLLRLFG